MKATFLKMDLTYQIAFSALSFELPTQGLALLKSIHDNINPKFPIASTDMQIFGGNSLSDVRVQVSMFNGSAQIEILVNQCSIRFFRLQNNTDVEICKDFISLIEKALKEALPNLQFSHLTINPELSFELDGGSGNASSYLAQITGLNNHVIRFDEFGSVVQHQGLNLEIDNDEEEWSTIMNVHRHRGQDSLLIVSCFAAYRKNMTNQRLGHFERMINVFLSEIGLEVSNFYIE